MSLNADQQDYVDSLSKIAPDQKCYCGWFRLGQCGHCPPHLTCADKLAAMCPECKNYPYILDGRPITHNIKCALGKRTSGATPK